VKEINRKNIYQLLVYLPFLFISIAIIFLYYIFAEEIIKSAEIEGMYLITILVLARMCFLFGISIYAYRQWFKQEAQYFTDIPALFGMFFTLYLFGKFFDLLTYLTYFQITKEGWTVLIKMRYLILLTTFLPMMYLSLLMFLYYLSLKENVAMFTIKKIRDEKHRTKRQKQIISIIFISEILFVIYAPNTLILTLLLPLFTGIAFIMIIWLFYYANKNKRLIQINTRILYYAFWILLMVQIVYAIARMIVGEWTTEVLAVGMVLIVETLGLIANIIVFFGFYLKSKYFQLNE